MSNDPKMPVPPQYQPKGYYENDAQMKRRLDLQKNDETIKKDNKSKNSSSHNTNNESTTLGPYITGAIVFSTVTIILLVLTSSAVNVMYPYHNTRNGYNYRFWY